MKTMKTKIFNHNLYIFAAILIIGTACQEEIKFKSNQISSKMVVNSFIEPDSLIKVLIAGSKPIPGVISNFNWIDNATVKLFVDGEEKETLTTYTTNTNSNRDYSFNYNDTESNTTIGYCSSLKAEVGKTYKLEITHPDYDNSTCETYIPQAIEIISVDTATIDYRNNWDYDRQQLKVALKFKDPANEVNYYRLIAHLTQGIYIEKYYDKTVIDSFVNVRESYISIKDPVITPEQENANDFLFETPGNPYNVFTDELIDGREYTVNFEITIPNFYRNEKIDYLSKGEFYQVKFLLQTLPRETYLFLKSSYDHHYYDGDLFAEPVQVFSNIENGLGIFGGQSNSVINISKGTYPMDNIDYRDNYYYNYGN